MVLRGSYRTISLSLSLSFYLSCFGHVVYPIIQGTVGTIHRQRVIFARVTHKRAELNIHRDGEGVFRKRRLKSFNYGPDRSVNDIILNSISKWKLLSRELPPLSLLFDERVK